MSMTEDEARYEQWMEKLYTEHSKQAIEQFTAEQLQSFYLNNALLAKPALDPLVEPPLLLDSQPAAAHIAKSTMCAPPAHQSGLDLKGGEGARILFG